MLVARDVERQMTCHKQLQEDERLYHLPVDVQRAVGVPEQHEGGDEPRDAQRGGYRENTRHVPAHGLLGRRSVVESDHHDRQIVEDRQQNDHDRGDGIKIEDEDRSRHE
jgi:hypothetical protein